MHKYIDPTKLHDFSVPKTFDDVYEDVIENYKITNILEDD